MPRLTDGLEQIFTSLGIVGSGYKLFFFEAGTTNLKTTYSDEALTVANSNPIVLNASGRPDTDVWGSDTSLYRMILGTPDSVVGNIDAIVDVDPVDNYSINSIVSLDPIPTAYWGLTGGTSTAYTLENPLVDIPSYSNTQTFFIDFNVACGDSPTLKIKELAAVTLKKYTGTGTKTNLVENDLSPQRYLCINDGSDIVVITSILASEDAAGIGKIATQDDTDTLTDDDKIVTPKKLGNGFGISLSSEGYIKLPSWLSGLTIQWGKRVDIALNQTDYAVTFPLEFNSEIYNISCSISYSAFLSNNIVAVIKKGTVDTTGFTFFADHDENSTTGDVYWFAIGK
jgi:hypothetical protein